MQNQKSINYLLENKKLDSFIQSSDQPRVFLARLPSEENRMTTLFLSESKKIRSALVFLTDKLCDTWLDVGVGRNTDTEIILAYEKFTQNLRSQISSMRKDFPEFINLILSFHDDEFEQLWSATKASDDIKAQAMNWARIFGDFLQLQIQLVMIISDRLQTHE